MTDEIQAVKIAVAGAFSSGKTELIRTISDANIASTENPFEAEKIAMDFGRITVDDKLALYMFGSPGPRRFDFMWGILGEKDFLGFIVVVDSSKPETFREAKSILETFRAYAPAPFVVVANKQDKPEAWDVDILRAYLRLEPEIPLLPCVAKDKEAVKQVLLALCYESLRQTEIYEKENNQPQ